MLPEETLEGGGAQPALIHMVRGFFGWLGSGPGLAQLEKALVGGTSGPEPARPEWAPGNEGSGLGPQQARQSPSVGGDAGCIP